MQPYYCTSRICYSSTTLPIPLTTRSPLIPQPSLRRMALHETLGLETLCLHEPKSRRDDVSHTKQTHSGDNSFEQAKHPPSSGALPQEQSCCPPTLSTDGAPPIIPLDSTIQASNSRQRPDHDLLPTMTNAPFCKPRRRPSALQIGYREPDCQDWQGFPSIRSAPLTRKNSNRSRVEYHLGKHTPLRQNIQSYSPVQSDIIRPGLVGPGVVFSPRVRMSTGSPAPKLSLSVLDHHDRPVNRVDKLNRCSKSNVSTEPPIASKGRWRGSPPPSRGGTSRPPTSTKTEELVDKAKGNTSLEPPIPSLRSNRKISTRAKKPVVSLAPTPCPIYQAMAHARPKLLPTPQRLLLVLDLNGTLLYRPKASTNFTPRPSLARFLDYCFTNHSVLIWSSARPANVSGICARLLSSTQRSLLLGEWARDTLELTPAQYAARVQVYKRLSRIWEDNALQSMHPQFEQGERWGQHNTVLIDDCKKKASSEPFNHVEVSEFITGGTEEKRENKAVLSQVINWLEEARKWDNLSAFVGHMRRRFTMNQHLD